MAHYALLNKQKEVLQVIVGANEDDLINGLSPEKSYSTIYNCIVKRTSYNTIGGIHYNRITNELRRLYLTEMPHRRRSWF